MTVSHILRQAFPDLTESDLIRMTSHAVERVYPPGVRLCNEGEMEETFYVLEDGTVEVFVQISPDETLLITELGPGECFGEMGLVANQPRSATVRTTSECRVLEIDKQTLESVLVNNPHLVLTMMRQISRNLWNNDRKTIEAIQSKNKVLARAYADLEAQLKMRSKFIATLSHELRTPLTAAQGFLHLINSGVVPAEQQGAALAKVTRNVEQVVAITNTLLILHEIDLISPRLAPVHLPNLVDEIILEVTRHRELPSSSVQNQVPADFGTIQADAASLGLALRSLIDNAVKFSNASPPRVSAERGDKEVSIQVTDQGIGMSQETLAHLFEPFYKAEGTGGASLFDGLGIGLVMARFIIERHGGTITASSQPGQGSTFTIHLPVPDEA